MSVLVRVTIVAYARPIIGLPQRFLLETEVNHRIKYIVIISVVLVQSSPVSPKTKELYKCHYHRPYKHRHRVHESAHAQPSNRANSPDGDSDDN